MSDSEIETDSSDWSYQGTTEEEESEGDDVFSVDEVVAATGVDFEDLQNLEGFQPTEDESEQTSSHVADATLTETSPSDTQVPDFHGQDREFHGDLTLARKRSKKADKRNWKVEQDKLKRMKGEAYLGIGTIKNSPLSSKCHKQRPPRAIGPTCESEKCKKCKTRHCEKFSESRRLYLFEKFWKEMDWGQKHAYVLSLADKTSPKREVKKGGGSHGEKHQVCRTMFLNTLGIKYTQLRYWLKLEQEGQTKRKRGPYNKIVTDKVQAAREFLDNLPKLPSHYCRQTTSKLYLEPIFTSKSQLYSEYSRHIKNCNMPTLSMPKFTSIFEEMNIGLYQPKKDQCDTCCAHEVGNLSDEIWKIHLQNKDDARDAKAADKRDAQNGNCHALVMDVQAVKIAPLLNASACYYKTKLVVHNFTIYDLKSHDARCCLWDESEGELVASVFATCLVKYIEEKFTDDLPIVIYSDGCTNQNRNAMMSTALLDYAIKNNKIIIQKFLEKGHTQMEVDSVHSAIECKLKKKIIYLPTDYKQICVEARTKPSPYDVVYLNHEYFNNYSGHERQRYHSIRPGSKPGDPCVTDIRQLKYNPSGIVEYKLDYRSAWLNLPRNPRTLEDIVFPALYECRLKIPKRKYDDLQDLLQVIPQQFHDFYINLPK
ncbi:hypothetical protein Fcan01_23603 [Folsomia candida]|uniref:Uncharacterized protein n=1 Tax=Folsomia candida TaxID=158441 RepID=A0A226D9Z5_FOLCA|nr:hypothetical protein Fcan01_23603 [Folsomia candida]